MQQYQDFAQVLYEYSANRNEDSKNDYLDELISAVVTENLILAENIAAKILLIDSSNQEARLVKLVKAGLVHLGGSLNTN